jgi:cell division protein FtsN
MAIQLPYLPYNRFIFDLIVKPLAMIKRLLIFLALVSVHTGFAIDNESAEFINKFNQLVITLRFEKFSEALPMLEELDKMDPDNPNIKYLMGVCYVATNTEKEKALDLLQNALKSSTEEYNPSYYKERRTPIYTLYYLGVCYCYHKRCDDAKKVFDEFISIISDNSNDYVQDARARMTECFGPQIAAVIPKAPVEEPKPQTPAIVVVAPAPAPTADPAPAAKSELKGNPELVKGLKMRKVVFPKKDPLYAVQVGAFLQQLPNTNFPNLKNVKSFVDKEGVIRYVVGGTTIRATAEAFKKAIIEAGYKDAFIVDINSKAKFEQEVLNAFNMEAVNLQSKKWAKLEYKVQIGAYRTREKMNEDMARKFIQIEGIVPNEEGPMTLLTVGSFGSYDDAKNYKKILVDQGVTDAFIIVYKNGQKTSTKEAGSYTSKDF